MQIVWYEGRIIDQEVPQICHSGTDFKYFISKAEQCISRLLRQEMGLI
jgi:hypothetical protein